MNATFTNTRLSPSQVITVYHDKGKSNYYLEYRQVKEVDGKLVMMAATPMPDSVLRSIAASYTKSKFAHVDFGSVIPEHILFGYNKLGMTAVIWYRPAMKRVLNFASHLRLPKAEFVNVPATLYVNVDRQLYVYALMTNDRPTEATKLFNAPFFNIYQDGNVCLGSARVGNPTNRYELEAERFETAFYMADQTGGQSDNNCKTPLKKLWPILMKSKAQFPSKKELVQHAKYRTLGDLMQKLIGKTADDV